MYLKKPAILLFILVLLLQASPVVAQVLESFTASVEGHSVELEWTTSSERNVVEFCLQRSFDGRNFYPICEMEPTGAGHTYNYIDNDLFKGNTRTFYYRLEIRHAGGHKEYSQTREVTLSFSGVYRTWGSIKAMFR